MNTKFKTRESLLKVFQRDIIEAQVDKKAGRVHSQQEIEKFLKITHYKDTLEHKRK